MATPAPPAPTPPPAADAPRPPGSAWPAPAPLPPEDDRRAWWKVVVPAAAAIFLVIVGLVVVFGGSDGGGDDASPPAGKGSVDISDLDDPTTTGPAKETTTTTETTTTVVAADGRIVVDADNGFAWTMATAPDIETPLPGVQTWTAVDGDTTETVRIITGTPNDLDAVLAEQVEGYDAGSYKLSKVQESHIEEADGRTASFTGTTEDGDPIVGYIVGAMVGDQAVFAMTTRTDSTLDDLYLDFLKLPASFDLG